MKYNSRIKRGIRYIKKHGILRAIVVFFRRIFEHLEWKLVCREKEKLEKKQKEYYDQVDKLVADPKYKHIFVFYPYSEWNLPIYQRPQQIAIALTEKRDDVLYFFCTNNYCYDSVDCIEKVNENLYVTTMYDYIKSIKTDKRIIQTYSTDFTSKYNELLEQMDKGDKILYEYIDEIHEHITPGISEEYLNKHDNLMKNEDVYLVTTADKLYNDAKKIRKDKYILATNGVKVDDFEVSDKKISMPEKLVEIKENYTKLIGYYGALAKWFDYELLGKCAEKYKDYAFVLIGIEYDSSLKDSKILEKYPNIKFIGKVPYKDLVHYSKNMDLLTIPFLINEITESTSPVKLFEYMAAQKPILTTDLAECRKYKSVNIGKNHEEYFNMIDKVLSLSEDNDYKKLELKEANANSWKQKAQDIVELLEGEK